MLFLGILVLASVLTAISFMVGAALVGRLCGAHILELGFGLGPGPRLRFGSITVKIGILPLGGGVVFLDAQQVDAHCAALVEQGMDEGEALHETRRWIAGRRLFNDLPLAARIATPLAGWLPILLASIAILGLPSVGHHLGTTYGQIFPFLGSTSFASEAIAAILALANTAGLLAATLVVALKITALNLLPLPMLTGGFILNEIFASVTGRDGLPDSVGSVGAALSFGGAILAIVKIVDALF